MTAKIPIKSGVTVDGTITATQASVAGEAVVLDNSTQIPVDFIPTISTSKISGLATVATSGSYVDLENKPIASTQVSITEVD